MKKGIQTMAHLITKYDIFVEIKAPFDKTFSLLYSFYNLIVF